ncbi:Omp28-related outer membrane protein [Alistipes sp. CHKCI003]|uniref:Omp28-related outer membrane protein n=1 Tax=Alistipes sp. CHKCI003 TaxID=1780376 RepID=UPI0007A7D941|nr:Omp28-related outer membrane protein [Alistipes sp. CHKCI003]CVI71899.1 Outer membrane protein Omp28 [Alistipes sp. CHKCI003]
MKNFTNYRLWLVGIALFMTGGLCAGCSGADDGQSGAEPEGKLRLEMSANYAKVGDTVNFTVYKGDVDVTANAIIRMKGDKTPCSPNYKADRAGTRYFAAIYNESSTSYQPVRFYVPYRDEGEFFKKSLVLKFTGAWCSACPLMYKYLGEIEVERPGRTAVMAVHSGDVFASDVSEELVQDYQITSFPHAVFDYKTSVSNNAAELNAALDDMLAEEPAICGIALRSAVEDGEAAVKARIRVAQEDRLRLCCAVVEDGLRYDGGSSDDGLSNYYHVLRRFITDRFGEDVGTREAGEEFEHEFVFPVPEEWKKENCTVFVYALRLQEDGETVYVNNTSACALDGGESDFEYEPVPETAN